MSYNPEHYPTWKVTFANGNGPVQSYEVVAPNIAGAVCEAQRIDPETCTTLGVSLVRMRKPL